MKNFIEKIKNSRHSNVYVILGSLFFISVIVRSLLAIKFSYFSIYHDELTHWSMSKSIAERGQTMLRGVNIGYSEMIYSALISIVHKIGDMDKAYICAKIMNSILMSSVVFPVYFMSMKVLKNKRMSLLIAVISIIIPEMCYTAKIIRENLLYPVFMWFWYMVIHMIEDDKFTRKNIILLGIYAAFISIIKKMGTNVFIGVMIFFIFDIILYKEKRKEKDIQMLLFLITFVCVKTLYVHAFNFLNSTLTSSDGEVVANIISSAIDVDTMIQLIYPFLVYGVMIIVAFGFYALLIPVANFKSLDKNSQKILILIVAVIFATICAVCLGIMPHENFGDVSIRIHLRYMFYMFIPVIILFFKVYDIVEKKPINDLLLFMAAVVIVLVVIVDVVPQNNLYDAPSLGVLMSFAQRSLYNASQQTMDNRDIYSLTIKSLITIIMMGLGYMLYKKKVRWLYNSVIILVIAISVADSYIYYNQEIKMKSGKEYAAADARIIDEYLKENASDRDVLLISNKKYADADFENYLYSNYFVVLQDDINKNIDDGKIDFSEVKLYLNGPAKNTKFEEADYIISANPILFYGYDSVNISSSTYKLYKRNNDKICARYRTEGVYNDGWMGKECSIELYDTEAVKETEVEVEINSLFTNKNSVEYRDDEGNTGRFTIEQGTNVYTAKIERADFSEPFKITLYSDKTFNLKQYSDRDISVIISDVRIKK